MNKILIALFLFTAVGCTVTKPIRVKVKAVIKNGDKQEVWVRSCRGWMMAQFDSFPQPIGAKLKLLPTDTLKQNVFRRTR